ncbi:MAG: pseudouridine synthase [Ginsengibacter sp.]
MNNYFVIHKPFQVLSQFSPVEGKKTLKDYFDVPTDVYPVGRLDYDSEGVLILTNDKKLNALLLNPAQAHDREYWVQVEGDIDDRALKALEEGVTISINGKKYQTKKSQVKKFTLPPKVSKREPPVRFRKSVPDSWISLSLTEGKNRQVRRMTAQAGFPTLRLIRYRIENLTLKDLLPGEMKVLSKSELYNLLKISK